MVYEIEQYDYHFIYSFFYFCNGIGLLVCEGLAF